MAHSQTVIQHSTFQNTGALPPLTVNNCVNATCMCVYGDLFVCMHGNKLTLPMQRLIPEK